MRPIVFVCNKAVLHRISVNVIDVSVEIVVVADRMFPIAPPPDAAFAFPPSRRLVRGRDGAREMRFQETPARRKVRVALRQRSDAMKMIA